MWLIKRLNKEKINKKESKIVIISGDITFIMLYLSLISTKYL